MTHAARRETGHYKNLANFQSLLLFCKQLGAAYRPGTDTLSLEALRACCAQCEALMSEINSCETAHHAAVGERRTDFKQLALLAPRIVANMMVINPNSPALPSARHLLKKLRGDRIIPVAPAAEAVPAKHISASQKSYDARLDHYRQLLVLVNMETGYQAHEPQLQPEQLEAFAEKLSADNGKLSALGARLAVLLHRRQELYYGATDSMLTRFRGVKQYMIAVYGSRSMEVRELTAITVLKLK